MFKTPNANANHFIKVLVGRRKFKQEFYIFALYLEYKFYIVDK